MDGSVPDLRGQLADFLGGTVTLVQFQRWVGSNGLAIELHGSDEDLELLNVIDVRLAEYTSDYIDAVELMDALLADPLVQKGLLANASAVA